MWPTDLLVSIIQTYHPRTDVWIICLTKKLDSKARLSENVVLVIWLIDWLNDCLVCLFVCLFQKVLLKNISCICRRNHWHQKTEYRSAFVWRLWQWARRGLFWSCHTGCNTKHSFCSLIKTKGCFELRRYYFPLQAVRRERCLFT